MLSSWSIFYRFTFLYILSLLVNYRIVFGQQGTYHAAVSTVGGKEGQQKGKCERISIPLCLDTPYNFTQMPNLFDHPDQQTAAISIAEYNILVNAQCSERLKFFLCSIYAPMCTETVDVSVTSCRSVCLKVHSKCMPLFESVGLAWPEALNCSKFPEAGRGTLCMDPDSSPNPTTNPKMLPDTAILSLKSSAGSPFNIKTQLQAKAGKIPRGQSGSSDVSSGIDSAIALCSQSLLRPIDESGRCGLPCDSDFMFDRRNKLFATNWTAAWSALCYLATWFTLVTFWLDHSRFQYPERPVICLSFCYNFYAFGYLIRLFVQPETIKCQQWSLSSSTDESGDFAGRTSLMTLITGSVDNSYCVVMFTILYYFSTASVLWWVILSFAWYLAAVKQWGAEAISNISQYFHLAAWGLPALLTIAVMVTRSVDASELNGVCFVGQHNANALLGFLIVPLSVFLVVGIAFITAGLLAMSNIRKQMRSQERTVDLIRFEKLMARIAIFSIMYGIPTAVVICCYAYEYAYVSAWSPFISSARQQCLNRKNSFIPALHSSNIAKISVSRQKGATPLQNFLMNSEILDNLIDEGNVKRANARQSSIDLNNFHSQDSSLHALYACQTLFDQRPAVEVYMLKIFMSLIVGIASVMWVLSKKTFWAWRQAFTCCFQLQKHTALNFDTANTRLSQFTATGPAAEQLPSTASTGPTLPLLEAPVGNRFMNFRSSTGPPKGALDYDDAWCRGAARSGRSSKHRTHLGDKTLARYASGNLG